MEKLKKKKLSKTETDSKGPNWGLSEGRGVGGVSKIGEGDEGCRVPGIK